MGDFIHVWTSDRIFTPKIRAALRSQIFNLIGNILRGCTYTFRKKKKNMVKKINSKNNKITTQKVYEVWRNVYSLTFFCVPVLYKGVVWYYILSCTIA